MTETPIRPDGRRLRAQRSQAAVVDAMLDLYRAGVLRPSVAEVARRAGVSERTVFRLFDDLESLAATTITRQSARVGHLFAPPDNRGGRDDRVLALIGQRLTLYDEIAPVMRATRLCLSSSATVREAAAARDRLLRRQTERQFQAELGRVPEARRNQLATALDLVVSLDALEWLRATNGLNAEQTHGVLHRMLHALLTCVDGGAAADAAAPTPMPGASVPPD